MNLGGLLSGAGRVAVGSREEEDAVRQSRLRELQMQAANRANAVDRAVAARGLQYTPPPPQAALAGDPRAVTHVPVAPPAPPPRVPVAQNPTTSLGRNMPPAPTPPAPEGMTREDFLALPAKTRTNILEVENAKRGNANIGKYAQNAAVWGPNAAADAGNWALNQKIPFTNTTPSEFIARQGRLLGVYGPETNNIELPKFPDTTLNRVMTETDYAAGLPSRTPYPKRKGGSDTARRANAAAGLAIPGGMPSADALASGAIGQNPYPKQSVEADIWRAQQVQFAPEEQQVIDTATAGDPDAKWFLESVLRIENRGHPQLQYDAVSKAKAEGPYQFVPSTAKAYGVTNPRDFTDATQGALRYLADLRSRYGNAPYAWLADYNGGSANGKLLADARPANNAETERYLDIAYGLSQGPQSGAVAQLATTSTPAAVSGPGAPAAGPAAAPAAGAPAAGAPARSTRSSPSQFYLSNPNAITADMARAQSTREQMVQMGNYFLQRRGPGDIERAAGVRAQLDELDSVTMNMVGMQGVQDLEESNDPRRLEQVLKLQSGQDYQFRLKDNHTADVYINGGLAHPDVPVGEIKDKYMSQFDQNFRNTKEKWGFESFKSQLKQSEDISKETAQTLREVTVKYAEGSVNEAMELLKARLAGWKVTPDTNAGVVYITPPGGQVPYVYNPTEGMVTTVDGVELISREAMKIPGLRNPPPPKPRE